MLYQFKSKPEDFFVEEKLSFDPSGQWDVFYVLREKRDQNTMDIVMSLCKKFRLERKMIWIAGLKDKVWVTRQWLAIYKSYLDTIWGEEKLLTELKKYAKILKTTWHNEPLKVWQNSGNNFKIRMRALKPVDDETKALISKKIDQIIDYGIPNCFGQQRFGKGNRNFQRAKAIMKQWEIDKDAFEVKFKLQAYPSMYFNNYAINRWNKNKKLLNGDIVVDKNHWFGARAGVYSDGKVKLFDYKKLKDDNTDRDFVYPDCFYDEVDFDYNTWMVTGPMIWFNLIFPPHDTPAWTYEWKLTQDLEFWVKWVNVAREYNIYWIRRPLRVKPTDLEYSFDWDDLIISFWLPTWSYATVLLWNIFKDIDYLTYQDNKLMIPVN